MLEQPEQGTPTSTCSHLMDLDILTVRFLEVIQDRSDGSNIQDTFDEQIESL